MLLAEREELWCLVSDNYPGYNVYQRRAGARRIPVMWSSPRAERHPRSNRPPIAASGQATAGSTLRLS